jgi:hypothetical protein
MKNLGEYSLHLSTHKLKPALQPATYLNQNRFLDTWEVVKTTVATKWMDDIVKERGYSKDQIQAIMSEVKAYEQKQNKEVTS